MERNYKYKAFLSYSHADQAWATWLHGRLETFRIPAALRDRHGGGSARLGTVFRDRDELATSHSLGETIRRALGDSEYLVVIASTQSVESRWVNEEIRHFLEHRDPSNVLFVIPPGQPPGEVPFPDAIRERGLEPVAADARAGGDGPSRATLKVIAGLLGVDFDDLRQRDRRRRRQRLGVASAAVLLVLAGAAVLTLENRRAAQEAEAQRAQAAELANFLVEDLAVRLEEYEEVGTLDAGLARALAYFERIEPGAMDDTTLENYRTALNGVGAVRIRQGKPEEALETFMRAERVSMEIVNRAEDNAERWVEQAAASFYIGEAYWEMQDVPSAARYIEKSMEYAERAIELAPTEYKYRMEVVFASNNLGAIHTRLKNWEQAERFSHQAYDMTLELMESELLSEEQVAEVLTQEAEAVSWLSEITQTLGRFEEAFDWHEREIELRHILYDATGNVHHRARRADALGYYSKSLAAVGRLEDEARALEEAIGIAETLRREDPDNVFWRVRLHANQGLLGTNLVARQRPDEALAALDEAAEGLERIVEEQGTPSAGFHLAYVTTSRALLAFDDDPAAARAHVDRALARLSEPVAASPPHPIALGFFVRAEIIDSALKVQSGEPPDGERVQQALMLLGEGEIGRTSIFDLAARALLLLAAGNDAEAAPLVNYLDSIGYRSPMYRQMLGILASGGSD